MMEPHTADDLYGVVPADFTAARNALVKRLKSGGRADEAARVAKLRRPSPPSWALNQVSRQRHELIELFLASGRRLREATTSALGGDRSALAEARAHERTAIDAVVDAAAQRLEGAGMSAGSEQRRKIAETLRSAAVDDAVAALLVRGVLDADHAAVGFDFGPVLALPGVADRSPAKGRRGTPTTAARRHEEARTRLVTEIEHLRETARAAHRAADEAATAAARLSKQAAAADAALAEAEERHARLRR